MNLISQKLSETVLVLAPTYHDASMAVEVLNTARIKALACESLQDLCRYLSAEVCGAVIVTEEAMQSQDNRCLHEIIEKQPAWSDIPILLLAGTSISRASEVFCHTGNVSILERPFSRLTLIRSAEVALRARRRQYEVKHLLDQQSEATKRRDEFFAALSHELRTPLNVIIGWIDLVRTGKLSPAEMNSALETLERNAKVQKGLIDDLLDVSRIVTDKMSLDFSIISLTDLARQTVNSFVPRANLKNIALSFHTPIENCMVWADEQRLTQVIANLLTNSIKFTQDFGEIHVSLNRNGNFYSLSVTDNGKGVDPEFLPQIFERLKQEDMSTTRNHGGLGLGLAIASHIVSEHKGKISAHSRGRGHGTTVTVDIPAAADVMETPVVRHVPAKIGSLAGVRILVVDDSPDILTLIRLWLEKANAEVVLANSASEALHRLSIYDPDILLSDIGMPEMDGYQLIKNIRNLADPKKARVPAVALTAYARDEEKTRAIKAGFQLHISKPITNRALVSAVASLLPKQM